MLGSVMIADTASAKMSKTHKRAIKKKLNRAVKKNPRVITKRWFLKKASIVNYTLPSTIRLQPAANQAGDPVSNDSQPGGADVATLDLGPSLGSRSVGLGGKVYAEIKFNDAFDSGAIGDVKVSIPSGGSTALTTTSVPLLTNTDVSTQNGGMNETQNVLVETACTGGTFTLTFNAQTTNPIPCPTTDAPTFSTIGPTIDAELEALSNIGAGEVYVAGPQVVASPFSAYGFAVMFTGTLGNTNQPLMTIDGTGLTGGAGTVATAPRQDGNANGVDGGCANFVGDNSGLDVDLPSSLTNSNDPGNAYNLGAGPYSPETGATENDVVLRTGPLTLGIASGIIDLPTSSENVNVGASGGRANLFGFPVNGLAAGNSVDVTVNLATQINSIAREVDGAYPGAAGGVDETAGNIAAYFNCRQAWTGYVDNYLTGINLTGSLKIAPAITADGKLRIAKVKLSTPTGKDAKVAVAACLSPYELYAAGLDYTALGLPADPFAPLGPSLIGGSAAAFNPLLAIDPQVDSGAPAVPCNDAGGPLDRPPFNVSPIPGVDVLQNGAAVAVSGDLKVTNLDAEVLIGDV